MVDLYATGLGKSLVNFLEIVVKLLKQMAAYILFKTFKFHIQTIM